MKTENFENLPAIFGYKIACQLMGGLSPKTFYKNAKEGYYDNFIFKPSPQKYLVRRDAFLEWIEAGGIKAKNQVSD